MTLAAIREALLFSFRHPIVRAGIAGFAVSVILLVFVGTFYWLPAKGAEESLRIRVDDKRREIFNADFSARLAQVSGHAALQVEQIERKLNASATQATLVQNLAALARQHNVRVVSEAYEEGKTGDGYSTFVHGLTLQAPYPAIRSFIAGLQGLPTFTVVQRAVLGGTSSSSDVKVQLDMITYRKMEKVQP